LLDALGRSGVSYEVIAVADGCTDGSPESIADLSPNRVCTIALPRNSGKGEALRTGLRHGRGAYLGFIDSDGDLDPALWQPFLSLLRLYRPDAVIGSKRHPLSVVDTAGFRRLFSRVFQLVNRCLFRLPVGDTQVGLKVFRRELLQDVLPRTRERGFVFDLEVLVLARRLGYRRLMEAPVSLCYQGRSTIRFGTLLRVAVETVALAWRMHTQGPVCQPNSPAGAGAPDPATGRPAPALPLAEAG
jgi:glycosyltransferase involved in cell wall biosynthesis